MPAFAGTEAEVAAMGLYVEATAKAPTRSRELHEVMPELLAPIIELIVAVEGPVHIDEITVRLKAAWSIQRAGARIQANIERSVALSVRAKRLAMGQGFLSIPDADVHVRDRSFGSFTNASSRGNAASSRDQGGRIGECEKQSWRRLLRSGARGRESPWPQVDQRSAVSGQLREIIRAQIDVMIEAGELVQKGDFLVVPEAVAGETQGTAAGTLH